MLRTFAGALVCAVALPLVASAAPASDAVAKTLNADYAQVCTTFQDPSDANFAAMGALLAPEFVHVDFKGKQIDRADYIAQGKQQMKMLHITTCSQSVDSTDMSDPNTVVANVTGKVSGTLQAPDGNHTIDVTAGAADTWKLENGTWVQTQSKDTSALVKIDGKVVQDEGN
jgi:hypothetical protein